MSDHPNQRFPAALFNPEFAQTAWKVALVVGTVLFTINHGPAVLQGKMTRARWISAAMTYMVPYMVNIHGQSVRRSRTAPAPRRELEKVGRP